MAGLIIVYQKNGQCVSDVLAMCIKILDLLRRGGAAAGVLGMAVTAQVGREVGEEIVIENPADAGKEHGIDRAAPEDIIDVGALAV